MDKSISVKDCLRLFYPVVVLVAAIDVLLWAHWNSLVMTAHFWDNDKYSHGYLVPIIAAGLLCWWRDWNVEIVKPVAIAGAILTGIGALLCILPFVAPDLTMTIANSLGKTVLEGIGVSLSVAGAFLIIQPQIDFAHVPLADRWIGFGILMAAEALRVYATHVYISTAEFFSFIPALAGVFVMTGGLKMIRWAGWAIVFLVFMLPLPGWLDKNLSGKLQARATSASTFMLQTFGLQARHEGNDIYIGGDDVPLKVEPACSGLRMLTIFGALSFAVVLLCERPLWQRLVILASWIPIALAVNIARITLTGVLFNIFPKDLENLRHFIHGMWGFVMMPMALGLMFLEFKILSNLVIEDDDDLVTPMQFNIPKKAPKSEMVGIAGNKVPANPAAIPTTGNGIAANGGARTGPAAKKPPRERASNS
ncbi:MAG TPA: exosortase/archaeosortase family protein [Pirellulales bacterium]|jgi:exosortase|nr:exosortase/archaeosortase family protein [Pirellulales bacterium]